MIAARCASSTSPSGSRIHALDPDLSLGEGTYFPNAEAGNFRVFDDSAPDRWGQTLMKRREAGAQRGFE
jgi:hypothetical protein